MNKYRNKILMMKTIKFGKMYIKKSHWRTFFPTHTSADVTYVVDDMTSSLQVKRRVVFLRRRRQNIFTSYQREKITSSLDNKHEQTQFVRSVPALHTFHWKHLQVTTVLWMRIAVLQQKEEGLHWKVTNLSLVCWPVISVISQSQRDQLHRVGVQRENWFRSFYTAVCLQFWASGAHLSKTKRRWAAE